MLAFINLVLLAGRVIEYFIKYPLQMLTFLGEVAVFGVLTFAFTDLVSLWIVALVVAVIITVIYFWKQRA